MTNEKVIEILGEELERLHNQTEKTLNIYATDTIANIAKLILEYNTEVNATQVISDTPVGRIGIKKNKEGLYSSVKLSTAYGLTRKEFLAKLINKGIIQNYNLSWVIADDLRPLNYAKNIKKGETNFLFWTEKGKQFLDNIFLSSIGAENKQ